MNIQVEHNSNIDHSIKIIAFGNDNAILENLFGAFDARIGSSLIIPRTDAKIEYLGTIKQQGLIDSFTNIIEFGLNFSTGVAASLVASWIKNKLKDRNVEIHYKSKVYKFTEDRLQECIESEIDIKC